MALQMEGNKEKQWLKYTNHLYFFGSLKCYVHSYKCQEDIEIIFVLLLIIVLNIVNSIQDIW